MSNPESLFSAFSQVQSNSPRTYLLCSFVGKAIEHTVASPPSRCIIRIHWLHSTLPSSKFKLFTIVKVRTPGSQIFLHLLHTSRPVRLGSDKTSWWDDNFKSDIIPACSRSPCKAWDVILTVLCWLLGSRARPGPCPSVEGRVTRCLPTLWLLLLWTDYSRE